MTIAVDLDGVIHRYSRGWYDGTIYDPPIPDAIDGLRQLMKHEAVFIHTTREPHQTVAWLHAQGLPAIADSPVSARVFWDDRDTLLVTNRKLAARAYLDDRAIRFISWDQALRDLLTETDDPAPDADAQVRGAQAWMALDLHMALGRPVDHSADVQHQGHGSWADWWADLCAEVRNRQTSSSTDADSPSTLTDAQTATLLSAMATDPVLAAPKDSTKVEQEAATFKETPDSVEDHPGLLKITDTSGAASDNRREEYVRAARTVRLRLGPNALAMAQRGEPIILNMNEADDLADAVQSVRECELEQLHKERDMLGRETDRLRHDWNDLRKQLESIQHLRQKWLSAGPPSPGTSISRWWDARLVELDRALVSSPPPGSTCEGPHHQQHNTKEN